mmetsp:Transcript_20384/g.44128  ORF Transcript_20384/g.44128 Transcript_20384/m.44128 type:complete len:105 (-) Transcript_20384:35-349(-)
MFHERRSEIGIQNVHAAKLAQTFGIVALPFAKEDDDDDDDDNIRRIDCLLLALTTTRKYWITNIPIGTPSRKLAASRSVGPSQRRAIRIILRTLLSYSVVVDAR